MFTSVSYALIEKHADPNILLPNGIAPLHLALGNDDAVYALQVTKLIMQHGGNPNLRTDDGITPLHIVAAWGHFELVQLLICCGADPEIRDYCNAMPIDYAVDNKHIDIARYLHYVVCCGSTFVDLQDKPRFNLTLDKIIINNGIAQAQYEVDRMTKSSFRLEQLPQATTSELIENWCSKHVNDEQNSNKEQSVVNVSNSPKLSSNTQFVNCNPRNYKKRSVTENISLEFECSSKFIARRSLSNNKAGIDIPIVSNECNFGKASQESGIVLLPDDSSDGCLIIDNSKESQPIIKRSQDASSDYFTCNEISGSTNILEKNIIDDTLLLSSDELNLNKSDCSNNITEDVTNPLNIADIFDINSKCSEDSNKDRSLNVVEVYKYSDEQEEIVLFESRLLLNQKSNENISNHSQSSKLTSLPASFDYDTDTLRNELKQRGFDPGPITKTTKRVYLRKLFRIKKIVSSCVTNQQEHVKANKVYSKELEKTLTDPNWLQDLTNYKNLEETVSKEFNNPDLTRRWREGVNKSSFTYLLLDPRITNNLPVRRDTLTLEKVWRTFISSIFYVGKGKRSRPYAHLYEAVTHWNKVGNITPTNKKLEHIIDIWKDDAGVVCLHVFQNVIPCEAYTREAAMIKALKLKNINNKKVGDFYGTACTWTSKQQKMLGVLLLHKAMLIFLNEGERQLRPVDIN